MEKECLELANIKIMNQLSLSLVNQYRSSHSDIDHQSIIFETDTLVIQRTFLFYGILNKSS